MEGSMDLVMSPLRHQNYLFGCELQADKDYHFKVDNDESEHQLCLQTVSLGADAKDELHIVEAEAMNYEGNSIKITLATLKMSVQPTVSLGGFEVTPPVVLRLKCGSGPVHVSGQHLVAVEEDAESEEEEEEDVKLLHVSEKRSAAGSGSKVPQKKVKLADKEDEDDDEDNDTNEVIASTMSQKKKEHPKRKITDEGRLFNEKWTDDYFFVEANSKALCLICREFVQVFEEYKLKGHYMQKHAAKFNAYEGLCRKDKIAELKKCLSSQQTFFQKATTRADSIVKASFVIAYLIAKKSKPFTEGEFIKQCIENVAGIICPEKKRDISKISLSHQTIARHIEEIGKSIERRLESKATNFKYYALAMVDSTDATDTAHLAIFIRGIDDEYNVTEELAALVPLKDTTKSRDLYEAVKNMLKQFSLSIVNISGIVTDGVPVMIGKREGLVKLIEDDAIAAQNSNLMKYHCIVHQENLCTKALKMDNVVQIIIKTVNFLRAKGLNHRQFQEFLKIIDADYGDMIYFSGVRWLSRSQILKRFYDLRHVIKSFMVSKNKFVPELDDENWLTDLAFLVDLTAHLNELNMRLQAENQLINTMFQTIIAFQMKLKLWQAQIKANNFMHFDTLAKHSPVNSEKYAALIFDLIQEFENRFQGFHENSQYFAIFATPFSVDINMLPASFQMECVELQSDIQLKEKFDRVSLLDFYRSYLPRDKYPLLHNHALFMSSLFGSTYICRQLFSRMKHIKSKIRTKISDKYLENSLKIATTSIKPDIDALVSQMQRQNLPLALCRPLL